MSVLIVLIKISCCINFSIVLYHQDWNFTHKIRCDSMSNYRIVSKFINEKLKDMQFYDVLFYYNLDELNKFYEDLRKNIRFHCFLALYRL